MQATDHLTPSIFELDRREGDGIVVSLLWRKTLNIVSIELRDERIGEELEFVVPPDRARDAFHHPYVYAARQGLLAAEAPREPVYA
jgi:hypothetical protein